MESEFLKVELDRIRYSLVWEDSNTLYEGLDIGPDDQVLIITSAGCNALNALLKNPAQVTAVDLNPVQNRLLLLKKHIILNHDHSVFRNLMGLDGAAKVADAWTRLAQTLPEESKGFWEFFFQRHPEGLMVAGKLERYLTGFYHSLNPNMQEKIQKLIQFDNVQEQRTYFAHNLLGSAFQHLFIDYFDAANLSKGRDPKLFKYAEESGGEAFYSRLVDQVNSVLVKDNFYFRFFFFGPLNIPEAILPPCYREQNYAILRKQLSKLQVVNAEVAGYLLSEKGRAINKASLSNVFEYTSSSEFEKVYRMLFANPNRSLRIVFWNLLQNQGAHLATDPWFDPVLSAALTKKDACFYFRNVRVQSTSPVPAPVKQQYNAR